MISSVNGTLLITSPLSASFPVTVGSLTSGVSFEAIVPLTQSLNQTLQFGSKAASNKVMHDMGMKKRTRITHRLSYERSSALRTQAWYWASHLDVSLSGEAYPERRRGQMGRVIQVQYHLLERRDEHLNEIERSGIHEFIRRPDQTNGFTR